MDSSQLRQRIIALYTATQPDGSMLGIEEIGPILGIHPSTVSYHLRRAGVPRRPKGQSKIFPHHRAEIIRQYTTRLPDGSWKGSSLIARDLGISDSAVQNVLNDAGIPIRSGKESHAYGKRCGPIKYTARLETPSLCVCGCGTPTKWDRGHRRWARFVPGHRYKDAPYKNEAWLREQYILLRRSAVEIAADFGVNQTTVIRHLEQFGIERRDAREAHKGVQAGAKNPAWKGGTTPERQQLYKTDEWKALLRSIYARDSYTCQRCKHGTTGGRSMRSSVAHHIKSFSEYPDLRMEPSNLITLCRKCHLWVHSLENIAREFLG